MIVSVKKDYSWNFSTCTCENNKYLKGIADTSVITCDEVISVMDIVSTKMTNTIATNLTKHFHSKKGRDYYIVYSFFRDHITIDNYYYLLLLCKA